MKVLLAIDEPLSSEEASLEVAKHSWPPDTPVPVLHVIARFVPSAAELWYDAGGSLEEARENVVTRYKELAEVVAERLRARGLTVETVIRDGDPCKGNG
jgi:nucleotide-binding universal stress UspA family protein